MNDSKTTASDAALELLYLLLEEFNQDKISYTDIPELPFSDLGTYTLLNELIEHKFVEYDGTNYNVTVAGEATIDTMPADWLISHTPISCHSSQK